MGDNRNSGWTDERVLAVTKLFKEGLSASQIAKQLGGVSRNAVIGKVHRLGLLRPEITNRRPPSAPRRMDGPAVLKLKAPAKPKAPLAIAGKGMVFEKPEGHAPRQTVAERIEGPGSATIHSLAAHSCRWPIGDPAANDFTFCGAKRVRGSYCHAHAAVAYQADVAPNGKKRSTANELAPPLPRPTVRDCRPTSRRLADPWANLPDGRDQPAVRVSTQAYDAKTAAKISTLHTYGLSVDALVERFGLEPVVIRRIISAAKARARK